ncbi:MAG: hypothetical protein QOF83_4188 [Solirubrobacteraceae bacterium]|jgi:hypothetical protein|nr:hypothetical protein [Solirubrobacteraceae bacterium]
MAERPIDLYLNDHLAGATLGRDLAEQIRQQHEGSPLGDVMAPIATQVNEDRATLLELMDKMETPTNPVKQATGWVAEKASRVKFSGMLGGDRQYGEFMALESLALGVQGKATLWRALKEVADEYPALRWMNLDELLSRAESQYATIERERLALGRRTLSPG